jgi:predicted nuclease of predicted toxin-antitoxin system
VKLLFDENLSYKLSHNLTDLFPDSTHVSALSLLQASDQVIWAAARNGGITIVTKDEDFPELAIIMGHPPKVIWIKLGNCSTGQVESLIRWRVDEIRAFINDPDVSVLELT